MIRLRPLAAPPAKPARGVAPHRFRPIGERVLVVDDSRRFALLTRAEHDDYLRGAAPLSVVERLAAAGFGAVEAEGGGAASLAGWRGPRRHVLLLERPEARMTPALVRAALDFAFTSPSPGLVIELACESVDAVWPALRFAVEYAQRRAEWGKRRVSIVARAGARAQGSSLEWLAARGVERRTMLTLSGAPRKGELPAFAAQTAVAVVDAAPSAAAAWIDWLSSAGLRSVRFEPQSSAPAAIRRFLSFYARALDRLGEAEGPLLDESLRALLAEPRWALPGLDVLEELCCDADGRLFTSERAACLPPGARTLFFLGAVGETRLSELAGHPAARAALAAAEPQNQPLCRGCAYASFCAIPASASYSDQGTTWGRMPESAGCALNMGRLDAIFDLSDTEKGLNLLNKYGVLT